MYRPAAPASCAPAAGRRGRRRRRARRRWPVPSCPGYLLPRQPGDVGRPRRVGRRAGDEAAVVRGWAAATAALPARPAGRAATGRRGAALGLPVDVEADHDDRRIGAVSRRRRPARRRPGGLGPGCTGARRTGAVPRSVPVASTTRWIGSPAVSSPRVARPRRRRPSMRLAVRLELGTGGCRWRRACTSPTPAGPAGAGGVVVEEHDANSRGASWARNGAPGVDDLGVDAGGPVGPAQVGPSRGRRSQVAE